MTHKMRVAGSVAVVKAFIGVSTMRRSLALTSAAALLFSAPGWAHAGTPSSSTLHRDELVTAASAAARTTVTLPTAIRLPGKSDCLLSRTARFAGTAKQTAVFLTRLPLTPDSRIIWIMHANVGGRLRTYDSECLSEQVPAGQYLLQLVHTPGTTSVRLRLPGLTGTGSLRVDNTDRSVIEELPGVLDTPASPATYSWGTRRDLATRGSVLTLGVIAAGLSDRGADTQGDCLLSADLAGLPDQVAYAPGCPAGSSGLSTGFTGTETWQSTLTSNIPAGSYGAGYWFSGTPTHTPLGAVSVWLTNLAN